MPHKVDPTFQTIIITFLIILFIIILYYVFGMLSTHIRRRSSTTYWLNHPNFRRGRFNRRCPRGCVRSGDKHDSKSGWACPAGSFCYNCEGNNPKCCCYDSQCSGC